MEQPEITALRNAYAALNRNDVDGFLADFDDEAVRIEKIRPPKVDVFRGTDAIREHVVAGRGTWQEGGCEPEKFVAAGDKIVATIHVVVIVKGQTDWMDGRVYDVYTWRDGKIVEFRSFADEGEALEFAGVSSADA